MVTAVEPDIIDIEGQARITEQFDDAFDVIGVDMADHQQLEPAPAFLLGNRFDSFT